LTPAGLTIATFLAPRLRPLYAAVAAAAGAELVAGTSFDQLAAGEVDAAFLCGLPYARLRAAGVPVEPIAAPVPSGDRYAGRPVYFTDVVVRRDDEAATLDELGDRTFAFNERASWSGYGAPLAGGIETAGAIFTGSHAASIAAVRSGAADAAAIDSHLLELLRDDDPALAVELRTIAALGPWPIQPLAAAPGAGGAELERLRAAAFELTPPDGTRVERFVAMTDADYAPIAAALPRA
jgi:phosphonate transport system substrate-binding protein